MARASHTPVTLTAVTLASTSEVGSTLTTLHAGGDRGGKTELPKRPLLLKAKEDVKDDMEDDDEKDELLRLLLLLLLLVLPL